MKEIYLLSSSSYNIINLQIKEIAVGNENITYHSLNDVTIYDCIDDASYFGLLDDDRIIVIKDVKYFGGKFNYEEETNALYNFLSSIDDSVKIIFVCDSIVKTKDITKKVISLGAKIFDLQDLTLDAINEVIANYVTDSDLVLDNDARDLILKNSLNNLDVALKDIEKISNINKHITVSLVDEYGIKLESVDTFEFSNAVISKNFNKAFSLLDKLFSSGIDEFQILGVLASSYINMFMVRDAVNHGLGDEEIAKKLGYSGTGRVYVMKKNSKIYTTEDLKNIIIDLSNLDIKLKTGYNAKYEIKEFLLNL
ncbi:MAG: DNA polymerase III subunit delta [Bacilli bacterium]|nr:DNA polymerase III subunit delta [Bacilli bacterium]